MTNARDKANIPVLNFQSKGIDDNADATAITINSSENVLVNTTSASGFDAGGLPLLVGNGSTHQGLTIYTGTSHTGAIHFADGTGAGSYRGQINYRHDSDALQISVAGSERLRILSNGAVLAGTTSSLQGTSHSFQALGTSNSFYAGTFKHNGSGAAGRVFSWQLPNTNSSSSYFVYATNDDGNCFNIFGNGNTEIRNSSPLISTVDTGDSNAVAQIDGNGGSLQFKADNNNNVSGTNITFSVDGSEKVRLENSGNFAIGHTTSGGSKLAVCDGANAQIQFFPEISTDTNLIQHYDPTASAYMASDNRASQYLFKIGTSEKMRIASNGHIGMGTTTTSFALNIANGAGNMRIKTTDSANLANAATSIVEFHGTDNRGGYIGFVGGDMRIVTDTHSAGNIEFYSNGSERMRIDSSGNVLVGKTASMYFVDGVTLHSGGGQFSNTDDFEMIVNRNGSDGTLVEFRHATVLEGSISVSGTTVSYNGFTGTHWSRFTDNSTPTILKGTVLETLDEMCDWYNLEFDVTTTTQDEDGNDVTNTITEKIPHVLTDTQSVGDIITYNHEATDYQATIVKETDIKHMKSKVSDNSDAKNVYGVFVAYDEDGKGYNDFYVASVGSFVVRIKQGETVAKGDLLQSNGDGTAKVQTDDAVRSSSFAKVLSTTIIETYEDGSYLVPCSLNC